MLKLLPQNLALGFGLSSLASILLPQSTGKPTFPHDYQSYSSASKLSGKRPSNQLSNPSADPTTWTLVDSIAEGSNSCNLVHNSSKLAKITTNNDKSFMPLSSHQDFPRFNLAHRPAQIGSTIPPVWLAKSPDHNNLAAEFLYRPTVSSPGPIGPHLASTQNNHQRAPTHHNPSSPVLLSSDHLRTNQNTQKELTHESLPNTHSSTPFIASTNSFQTYHNNHEQIEFTHNLISHHQQSLSHSAGGPLSTDPKFQALASFLLDESESDPSQQTNDLLAPSIFAPALPKLHPLQSPHSLFNPTQDNDQLIAHGRLSSDAKFQSMASLLLDEEESDTFQRTVDLLVPPVISTALPKLHPLQTPHSLFNPIRGNKMVRYFGDFWMTPNCQWIDPNTNEILKQGSFTHEDLGYLASNTKLVIPNPVWPSLSSLAETTNKLITLRPFEFWRFQDRKLIYLNQISADQVELVLQRFHDAIRLIPPETHGRSTISFFAFPVTYTEISQPNSNRGYIKFWDQSFNPWTSELGMRIRSLVETASFFSSILANRVQRISEFCQPNKKFLDWLKDVFFTPDDSLPVVGSVKATALENIRRSGAQNINLFGVPQKLFFLVVTKPTFANILDPTALSLLALWYRQQESKIWSTHFVTEDGFWRAVVEEILMRNEFRNLLHLNFWS
ncbi:hypothetical protein O181_041368 [Austropuccinia psidii MF-1]|uniref:Uncharacterized protein n=1 Tax=Austropuccinia psidii MF-1 TaxID=1389203 RepID=A0A9Q3HDQ7_9BASI|nr:hypothetical protein [Austropuccinia psidii MF-1]